MLDSHCHLADEAFAADLEEVVARARGAGLKYVLTILAAGDPKEAARAETLASLWPDVRFSVGVHPHQAKDFAGRVNEIATVLDATMAANPRVRAVGEIGLDYHYDFSPRHVQHDVFLSQVEYACARDLPLVIHTREATEDTLGVLREAGQGRARGVFHCFSGDDAMARGALDLGFHLSFAGIVSFPKAPGLRAIAGWIPADRYLIETDSPYLAPVPYRGKRNEPAFVTKVAEVIARERNQTMEEVSAQVLENFARLFKP